MYTETQINHVKEAVQCVPIWDTMNSFEQYRWMDDFYRYCEYSIYDIVEYIMDHKENMTDQFLHLFCGGFMRPKLWRNDDQDALYYYECLEKSIKERLRHDLKAVNWRCYEKVYLSHDDKYYYVIAICETPDGTKVVHLDDWPHMRQELFNINKLYEKELVE